MSNAEIDRMFAYHERTKHSYASVYSGGWTLDWDNQPNPFRRYAGAPRVELPPPEGGPRPEAGTSSCLRGLGAAGGASWPDSALPLLGSLLFHSLSISAWKHVLGTDVRYSLRVNPSSGNLHPTETWIVVRGFDDLPDGLYHYDVRGGALERRRSGDALGALDAVPGLHPLGAPGRGACVVLTSIFWREAWKYRDRALRYCLHDAGHVAGSLLVAARSAERSVELVLRQRLLQAVSLHDVGVQLAAVRVGAHALLHALLVDVHDQLPTQLLADELLAELDHLAELPRRVHVHERKRRLARVKGLLRQPYHHARVLADRVQHHRLFELRRHLADDVDALGLELLQMGEVVGSHR